MSKQLFEQIIDTMNFDTDEYLDDMLQLSDEYDVQEVVNKREVVVQW